MTYHRKADVTTSKQARQRTYDYDVNPIVDQPGIDPDWDALERPQLLALLHDMRGHDGLYDAIRDMLDERDE